MSEENRSVTTAADLLLGKMCDLEEMGWFQGFLDALLEGGMQEHLKEEERHTTCSIINTISHVL